MKNGKNDLLQFLIKNFYFNCKTVVLFSKKIAFWALALSRVPKLLYPTQFSIDEFSINERWTNGPKPGII